MASSVKNQSEKHDFGTSATFKSYISTTVGFVTKSVSYDHNQLAQSSPQVQLDSSEVPSDPIFDITDLDEIDNGIDSCLCETTKTPNTKSTTVQYILPPRSNRDHKLYIPLVNVCHLTGYPSHMHHLYLNYHQFIFLVIYRKLWQILDGPK
ncbi:uncharacterized protein LOC111241880 [Vigna radiata var. radiata]|uniref:Uncharacterized protein LOC111241880 n=1 Tax=Vigna radiata var. radiata TaxID=3916 RepID=A0A3Q0F292_VIGRR|nr:uncharacterized protein LOC111241880 [Vigna radiata var. radiata]